MSQNSFGEHLSAPPDAVRTNYREVLEALGDIVYKIDPDGRFVYVNGSVKVLGYEPMELIGEHFSIIIHPEDLEAVSRAAVLPRYEGMETGDEGAPGLFDERRGAKRMTRNLEIRLVPKGWGTKGVRKKLRVGTAVAFGEVSAAGQYDAFCGDGAPQFLGTVGVIRDITRLRRAQHALKQRETLAKAALDAQRDAFVLFTANSGTILWCNSAFRDLVGTECGTVRPRYIYDVFDKGDVGRLEHALGEVRCAGYAAIEGGVVGPAGGCAPYEFSLVAVKGEGARPNCVFAVGRDLTERKRIEEGRLRAHKLDSLTLLAGGIAHDFNNMLTGIAGNISLGKTLVERDTEMWNMLDTAERISLEATSLTRQLLTFAQGGKPMASVTSLGEFLQTSATFALRGCNASCEFRIEPDLRRVTIDHGQMYQVIHNLLVNAVQAMPDGGHIVVGAANIDMPPGQDSDFAGGQYVCFWVSDQGCGIDRRSLARIFDPYFTTKKSGTGLGLAICQSIVNSHGGRIEVASEEGKGSSFTVYLPASSQPACSGDSEEALCHGRGRVLCMDDNEPLRRAAAAMLCRLGYEVETAAGAQEAISLYRRAFESHRPFDVVILDLTIQGGMSGVATLEQLRRIDPSVKAVLTTGYSNDAAIVDFKTHGFIGAIRKPFSLLELSRVMADALCGKRNGTSAKEESGGF